MEDPCRIPLQDSHLASRKAEEAALRRFQAAAWLENLVGPLGLPNNPSESEFLSCLRSGLVLCNAINRIQPGSVPKVVENHSPSLPSEFQPLPAYQYFENVRNFLVAVEELKVPAFEASDLERDTMEAGSTAKIVDCILALKCYHEWKQWGGAIGSWKYMRSPIVLHSASRMHSRGAASIPPEPCRRLDMSTASEKQQPPVESRKLEDSVDLLAKALADCLLESKENVDSELLDSFGRGNQDSFKAMTRMLTSCLQEQKLNKFPELKSALKERLVEENSSFSDSLSIEKCDPKCCNSCLKKGHCNHRRRLEAQERNLRDIKTLLSRAKNDFKVLQFQLQSDLVQLGSQVQGLSTAALGYHQVVKENRNLYNVLQDLKGNIRVYCRIRPAFNDDIRSTIDFVGDDGSLIIVDPIKPLKDSRKAFQFNKVFGPTASQEDVFKDTRPLIRSVMDGYNVCIFAYGQTGSGKTHTMCGPPRGSSKGMGINYLALNDLFKTASKRKDIMRYKVQVQMVEIYNEQVRDLLSEDASTTKLEIRNCTSNGGLTLPDANMHLVRSTIDVLNLMKLGETNRVVGSTAVNNRSSRSHSILTVHVEGKDSSGTILRSCLHLVDLAGSERVDKSEVTGDRLKEAQHINKSLSCLGDVITALAQKNSHVPYRNSKLTQLLQDSLGGHAKTLMFAHVSPEADSYGETISTLKFAQRVSTVELGAARVNKEGSNVRELKEQIESLKKALAKKEEESALQTNNMKDQRSPIEKQKVKSEQSLRSPIEKQKVKSEQSLRSPIEKQKVKSEQSLRSPTIEKQKVKSEQSLRSPIEKQKLKSERSLRSPIEKQKVKSEQSLRSINEKQKVKSERTPPRPRRLSIENPNAVTAELANPSDDKRGSKTSVKPKMRTEHTPVRLRRLSLGGHKKENDEAQVKKTDDVHLTSSMNEMILEMSISCPSQGPVLAKIGSGSAVVEVSDQYTPSPTKAHSLSRSVKTESISRIPQLTRTPEPSIFMRKEVQVAMENEACFTKKSQLLNSSSTNRKGSQIRKSLKTIGKIIHGSERRIHQHPLEARSPVYNRNNNDVKSPLSAATARALRRQSLTGVQPDTSRRSSLGGKSTDSFSSGTRIARTPPPVQPHTMAAKQWL